MIARLCGLFTIGMLTIGAATGPLSEDAAVRELRAASRLVRDGDLQADWNKLLDARARLERLVHHKDIAAIVHYQLGYAEWRLSALVYMSTGFRGQAPHWKRAIAELEQAVELRPDLTDAKALIGLCTGPLLASDPSQADQVKVRLQSAWKTAFDAAHTSPRALLIRAMTLFSTPPAYGGNQTQGLELWHQAIEHLEKEKPRDPLAPEWGLAEAWGWLGGAYLMQGDYEKAVPALQRALDLRKDFWWVSRIALPQATRPALAPMAHSSAAATGALARIGLPSVVIEWARWLWSSIGAAMQSLVTARAGH